MWEATESIESCCGMERWPWSWTVLVREASWGGTDDLRVFLTHVPAVLGVCCMIFCSSPCRPFPEASESATSSCTRGQEMREAERLWRISRGDMGVKRGAQPGRGTGHFQLHSYSWSPGVWPPFPTGEAGKASLSMCLGQKGSKLSKHNMVFVTSGNDMGKHKGR